MVLFIHDLSNMLPSPTLSIQICPNVNSIFSVYIIRAAKMVFTAELHNVCTKTLRICKNLLSLINIKDRSLRNCSLKLCSHELDDLKSISEKGTYVAWRSEGAEHFHPESPGFQPLCQASVPGVWTQILHFS